MPSIKYKQSVVNGVESPQPIYNTATNVSAITPSKLGGAAIRRMARRRRAAVCNDDSDPLRPKTAPSVQYPVGYEGQPPATANLHSPPFDPWTSAAPLHGSSGSSPWFTGGMMTTSHVSPAPLFSSSQTHTQKQSPATSAMSLSQFFPASPPPGIPSSAPRIVAVGHRRVLDRTQAIVRGTSSPIGATSGAASTYGSMTTSATTSSRQSAQHLQPSRMTVRSTSPCEGEDAFRSIRYTLPDDNDDHVDHSHGRTIADPATAAVGGGARLRTQSAIGSTAARGARAAWPDSGPLPSHTPTTPRTKRAQTATAAGRSHAPALAQPTTARTATSRSMSSDNIATAGVRPRALLQHPRPHPTCDGLGGKATSAQVSAANDIWRHNHRSPRDQLRIYRQQLQAEQAEHQHQYQRPQSSHLQQHKLQFQPQPHLAPDRTSSPPPMHSASGTPPRSVCGSLRASPTSPPCPRDDPARVCAFGPGGAGHGGSHASCEGCAGVTPKNRRHYPLRARCTSVPTGRRFGCGADGPVVVFDFSTPGREPPTSPMVIWEGQDAAAPAHLRAVQGAALSATDAAAAAAGVAGQGVAGGAASALASPSPLASPFALGAGRVVGDESAARAAIVAAESFARVDGLAEWGRAAVAAACTAARVAAAGVAAAETAAATAASRASADAGAAASRSVAAEAATAAATAAAADAVARAVAAEAAEQAAIARARAADARAAAAAARAATVELVASECDARGSIVAEALASVADTLLLAARAATAGRTRETEQLRCAVSDLTTQLEEERCAREDATAAVDALREMCDRNGLHDALVAHTVGTANDAAACDDGMTATSIAAGTIARYERVIGELRDALAAREREVAAMAEKITKDRAEQRARLLSQLQEL